MSGWQKSAKMHFMESFGKLLVLAGVILAVTGLIVCWNAGKGRGGFLPGDLVLEKDNFKLYFPVVTCLILSAVVTFLFWLLRKR